MIFVAACLLASTHTADPLALHCTIPLEGVTGRIDHLAYDPESKRLFVAALGNGSVEVIDLEKGERVKSITSLAEPQGAAYVPGLHGVVVASGGDGSVRWFDGASLAERARKSAGDDADNVRYVDDTSHVIVGWGSGELAILDAKTLDKKTSVALPAHPESFQIFASGKRALVNVPGAGKDGEGAIAAIDLVKNEVTATYGIHGAASNFPMAIDSKRGRAFVGCRKPAKLAILDLEKGDVLALLDCVGDADDLFVDAETGNVLVIGGEGRIDVFSPKGEKDVRYERVASVATLVGARTGLLVPSRHALYLAAPKRDDHPAQIREYLLSSR